MPGAEYVGWLHHFRRHPPGDFETHRLLRLILSVVCTAATQGKEPYPEASFALPGSAAADGR